MTAFRADPEDARRVVTPGSRSDEIGRARRELAAVAAARCGKHCSTRSRLAALGTAVAKINHDLRNILASAQLVSDHIRVSPDPGVRKIAPTLLGALDRAIRLCTETIAFAHEGEAPPSFSRFDLRGLVTEVGADLLESGSGTTRFLCQVPQDLTVEADREQLRRVLTNLTLNAFQATAQSVRIGASLNDGSVRMTVTDDGPGLPEPVRENSVPTLLRIQSDRRHRAGPDDRAGPHARPRGRRPPGRDRGSGHGIRGRAAGRVVRAALKPASPAPPRLRSPRSDAIW